VGDVDEFNYDKGMTLASLSKWAEAERYLLMVKNPAYKKEKFYITWLCRCFIKNKKPMAAWNLYLDATSTEDSKTLLRIIAADCYASEQYYYAMKAYDVLSKYETDPSFRDGLVASAVGVYRDVLTRKESSEKLKELISVLAQEPETKQVLDAIRQHALSSGELDDSGY
jgi:intraflagellar transport protein 56